MKKAILKFINDWIDFRIIAIGIWIALTIVALFAVYITIINPDYL